MIPNTMWPMLLDMSRDECKRILRRLELEAYSSIVSALRAQGSLSTEKRKLLNDLSNILNISVERHRAEVRRAVNDEKLATIAEHMAGPNTSTEWAIEGRRLVPLMPRLVPQTALTALANKMADITATENAKLPPPAQTFKLKVDDSLMAESSRHDNINPSRNFGSLSVPTVLPVKRVEKEEERCNKRRCRSSSNEHVLSGGQPLSPPTARNKAQVFSSTPQLLPQVQQQPQPQYFQNRHPYPQMHQGPSSTVSASPSQLSPQQHQPLTSHQVNMNQNIQSEVILPHSQPQQLSFPQQQQPAPQPQSQPQPQQLQLCTAEEANKETPSPNSQHPRLPENLSSSQMTALKIQEVIVSSQPTTTLAQPVQTTGHTRVVSGGSGNAPVKITFTSSTGRSTACNIGTSTTTTLTTTTPAPTTQKVIIVQSSAAAVGGGPPSILQRSLTVPVVKSSPAAAAAAAAAAAGGNASAASRASLIISGPSGSPPVTPTTIVTISTNPVNNNNVTATTVSIGGVPTAAYITSPGNIPHIRPKAVQLPSRMRTRPGSIVIPVTPNSLGTTTNLPGVTLKTTPIQTSRSGVHVKTECSGMKIVPIATGTGGATKILPKPSFGGTTSQSPLYMMSTTTSSITMVTRTVSTSCPSSRMVTVNATTLPSSVQVTPTQNRPITTLVTKGAPSGGAGRTPSSGKPNVIVVQKGSCGTFPRGVTVSGGRVQGFSATLQDVLSKVVGNKSLGVVGSGGGGGGTPVVTTLSMQKAQQQGLHLPPGTQAGNVVVLDLSHENVSKNMVLADILQASGITSDADVDPVVTDKGEEQGDQIFVSETLPQTATTDISETLQINDMSSTSSHAPTIVATDGTEITGELDPQTGIYSLPSEPSTEEVSQGSSVTIVPNTGTGNMDIFSTALASADINLETLQYMEEGLGCLSSATQPNSNIEVTVGEAVISAQENQENVQFLEDIESNSSDTTALTLDRSHVDSTVMHVEDNTSQKAQGQEATE